VGYMGGVGDYPTYNQNYTALNYSETLRLKYDPAQTNFTRIMDAYWKYAPSPSFDQSDPAYMMRIFTTTPEQYATALASKAAFAKQMNATLYVSVYNATDYEFWKGEEYNQQFNFKEGSSCQR
jgi:peptide methionine sulfoxide reductase MsrA